MSFSKRLLLALALVVLDFVTIGVPLCAIAAAYIIVARPPVFLRWVLQVYDDSSASA